MSGRRSLRQKSDKSQSRGKTGATSLGLLDGTAQPAAVQEVRRRSWVSCPAPGGCRCPHARRCSCVPAAPVGPQPSLLPPPMLRSACRPPCPAGLPPAPRGRPSWALASPAPGSDPQHRLSELAGRRTQEPSPGRCRSAKRSQRGSGSSSEAFSHRMGYFGKLFQHVCNLWVIWELG